MPCRRPAVNLLHAVYIGQLYQKIAEKSSQSTYFHLTAAVQSPLSSPSSYCYKRITQVRGILDLPSSPAKTKPIKMAPPLKNPKLFTWHFCFLLLVFTATHSAAVSTSHYKSVCSSLPPSADSHTDAADVLSLTRSFQISTGHFSGGDNLFSPDDDDLYGYNYRSFSLFPHGASRTKDPALVHLTATLTLNGPRRSTYQSHGRRHRGNYTVSQSISFVLDGYYSNTSLQLCMAGTATELAADGSLKHYSDVVLQLRVPSPPKLNDPFVSGTLEGSNDFGAINLLAYAEGDDYKYAAERSPCSSPSTMPVRGTVQAFGGVGANFSCAHLKEQLMTSYKLEHGGGPDVSASASSPLLRMPPRMHINQMQCTADGAVRAYMVFSNNTESENRGRRVFYHYHQRRFLVDEEAVVADGHWDSIHGVLCLRACRVVRSAVPSAHEVSECGIRMSFWFPSVWTMLDRSLVAGMLWNSSQPGNGNQDAGQISGVLSASSIDTDNQRSSNLSDVKYNYNTTMIEEAKKQYLKIKDKIKGSHSFPGNYTYHDFELRYFATLDGNGNAYPVTLGSVMVLGDRLAADDSFTRHAVFDTKHDLLNVSYDIHHYAPPDNWVRPTNGSYSYSMQERRISAEGVYDPKRGILCMVGCRELNVSTMDCQTLVTVLFASQDARAQGHSHGRGAISSLREETDSLFFKKIDINLYGMYSGQISEAISRMDLESIMLVASTTLSCVFTVLQILHTKKKPEAAPATSITMLAILTLGYLTPLVLNFEALFVSRRSQYFTFSRYAVLELKEVMMRAPMLIALVLQLRLLQLVWSGRQGSADQSKSATAPSVSERIVLQICLPLYLLGGVLAGIVHVVNVRAAREDPLVVRIGGEAPTIWEDLVSYAGLILDGFLLPQIILNASLAGSGVRAISPWFYMGGTMIRAMPHVYDVVRARVYEPSISPSDVYASPRSDLFGVAWDIVIPCGAALLALLLFLQQRLGGSQRRRSGGYEMVSNL